MHFQNRSNYSVNLSFCRIYQCHTLTNTVFHSATASTSITAASERRLVRLGAGDDGSQAGSSVRERGSEKNPTAHNLLPGTSCPVPQFLCTTEIHMRGIESPTGKPILMEKSQHLICGNSSRPCRTILQHPWGCRLPATDVSNEALLSCRWLHQLVSNVAEGFLHFFHALRRHKQALVTTVNSTLLD